MKYVEQLFDYNKDENDEIVLESGEVLNSPQKLQEYIIAQVNSDMEYENILEFNFEDFAYDYANTNLEKIQEKVNLLTEYVGRVSHGGTPIVSLSSVIIKHWLKKINELIESEKV